MTQHWFQTVDFQPPSLPCIQQGLDIIEQEKTSGQSVYVHCKAGKGRSAVVAACYLIKVTESFSTIRAGLLCVGVYACMDVRYTRIYKLYIYI